MKEAFLGLGTNLGNREKNLKQAILSIESIQNTEITRISSIYETPPFGVPDKQENYLNCCVRLKTPCEPKELLHYCLGIENQMGRVRTFKNAARIIDIDLLLYEGATLDEEELTLPHPRMQERAFVLIPLSEIYKNTATNYDIDCYLGNVDKKNIKIHKDFYED